MSNKEDDFEVIILPEGYVPPRELMREFARRMLPLIQEFYEDPENVKAFEEWLKEQEQ